MKNLLILVMCCFTGCKPSTDIIRTYYSDGKIESEINFPDKRDTLIYFKKIYNHEGAVILDIKYNHDQNEGIAMTYYEDGKMKEKVHIKNGKFHGIFRSYFRNGNIDEYSGQSVQ